MNGDQYYINITVADEFNIDTPNVYQINLLVMTDSAPTILSSKSLSLGTVFVNTPFSFKLSGTDFVDKENDTPILSCTVLTVARDFKLAHRDNGYYYKFFNLHRYSTNKRLCW